MELSEILKLNEQAEPVLKVGIRVKISGGKWVGKTGTIIKHDPCFGLFEWVVEIKNAKKKHPVKLCFNATALVPID